jgi:SAM-dependent methyltransferase
LQGDEARRPESWTVWRAKNHAFFGRALAGVSDGAVLLDVGCGPGHFLGLLSRFRRIALDFEPYDDCHVLTDINRRLPFRDGSADVTYLSNVLEHLWNPQQTLGECFRVLKPGGRLVLSVPFVLKVHQAPHDFFRYTEFGLNRIARTAGFLDVSVEPIGNLYDLYVRFGQTFRKHALGAAGSRTNRRVLRVLFSMLGTTNRLIARRLPAAFIEGAGTGGIPWGYGLICRKHAVAGQP